MFSPDKHKTFLHLYRTTSWWLLPFTVLSYGLTNHEPISKFIHASTVTLYGYHSYVSTSCVITDYMKRPLVGDLLRVANAKFHLLGTIGFLKLILERKNIIDK